MKKIDSLNSGYSINKVISTSSNNNQKQQKSRHYPNGIIPFIFINIVFVLLVIVSFSVGFVVDKSLFQYTWKKYLISSCSVPLLLDLLWLIARSGLFISFGYYFLKVSKSLKINKLKQKIHLSEITNDLYEIDNYQQYSEYCNERIKHTKKWMIISFITHSLIFVVGLIVYLVVISI